MADCLCGHAKREHRTTISGGRVFPHCTRCDGCNGFGIIDGTVILPEPLRQTNTLLYAWDTRWCPTCGSRYFPEDASCCGQPCMPVRVEMHSREPL